MRYAEKGGNVPHAITGAPVARAARTTVVRSVDTALIDGADHMYTGEERQVARVIDGWVRRAVFAAR